MYRFAIALTALMLTIAAVSAARADEMPTLHFQIAGADQAELPSPGH